MPAETYEGTRLLGPLASFDMTETWVHHPYRDGRVLIGDAAGASDPTWGRSELNLARCSGAHGEVAFYK
jgi:flavin-dependent dehydrogenase